MSSGPQRPGRGPRRRATAAGSKHCRFACSPGLVRRRCGVRPAALERARALFSGAGTCINAELHGRRPFPACARADGRPAAALFSGQRLTLGNAAMPIPGHALRSVSSLLGRKANVWIRSSVRCGSRRQASRRGVIRGVGSLASGRRDGSLGGLIGPFLLGVQTDWRFDGAAGNCGREQCPPPNNGICVVRPCAPSKLVISDYQSVSRPTA